MARELAHGLAVRSVPQHRNAIAGRGEAIAEGGEKVLPRRRPNCGFHNSVRTVFHEKYKRTSPVDTSNVIMLVLCSGVGHTDSQHAARRTYSPVGENAADAKSFEDALPSKTCRTSPVEALSIHADAVAPMGRLPAVSKRSPVGENTAV
eukprot:CAMPEP_0198606874 /NCGR_PEP_ID=MMETSP1462-20131121/155114_1 /TAXON_ID=1333877 /ORGANISM="Brandtodinium nutriculum, Strain RCC3387" /LENGTH=148 /DNA_ID=CAMNT_0044338679 /DNA_START=864 /DNA_END=1307 /DNA_ORIENTATION=+